MRRENVLIKGFGAPEKTGVSAMIEIGKTDAAQRCVILKDTHRTAKLFCDFLAFCTLAGKDAG
jgi:hypothetical protein